MNFDPLIAVLTTAGDEAMWRAPVSLALDGKRSSVHRLAWFLAVVGPALAAGLAHGGPPPARRTRGPIDARQAVRIAERFVRENGYTDFVPTDLRRLVPESVEFSRDRRQWLKQRHNELHPRAVGYREGSRNDPKGWTVGFGLVDTTRISPTVGRAVTMDKKGRNVMVQHLGFNLTDLEPRPD